MACRPVMRPPTRFRPGLREGASGLEVLEERSLLSVIAGPIRNPSSGHEYYLLSPATWTASEAEAQALGGHLVTINDAAENSWTTALFPSEGLSTQVWTGLNRTAATPFAWSSGSPVVYFNWAPGEPNNMTGEEFYGAFYSLDTVWGSRGTWNDAPDSYVFNAIAEVDPAPGARPDLNGVFLSAPETATPGQRVCVSISLDNTGTTEARGKVAVGYYLSADDALDAGDLRLGRLTRRLALRPDHGTRVQTTLAIPRSVARGTYHLIVRVDDSGAIDEGNNKGNNVFSTPITVRTPGAGRLSLHRAGRAATQRPRAI